MLLTVNDVLWCADVPDLCGVAVDHTGHGNDVLVHVEAKSSEGGEDGVGDTGRGEFLNRRERKNEH